MFTSEIPLDIEVVITIIRNLSNETKPVFADPRLKDYVFVLCDYEWVKVRMKDIVSIEADRNYCNIYTAMPKHHHFSLSIPMKEVLEDLPLMKDFIQVSRSSVVNMEHVNARMGNTFKMDNGMEVQISKAYRKKIDNMFVYIGQRKRVKENK